MFPPAILTPKLLQFFFQIPFYPVVKKDLTFIHLGNDSRVEGLVNFEKLRMIAKEVRTLTNMCSSPYDLLTMLERGGQPPSSAMVALNQMTTGNQGGQTATVKRRKKSTAAPNQKKMFEEAQMVRRVKAYLANMKVITDEERLHALSIDCEPHAGAVAIAAAVPLAGNRGRRHPSPTLSTTSSASSTSEGRKSIQGLQPCSNVLFLSLMNSYIFNINSKIIFQFQVIEISLQVLKIIANFEDYVA